MLDWRKGKVTRIENATEFTRRFWIEAEGNEPFGFKPGQFVTLDLPIHEKKNKRWRSYSIASWPDGTNVFELIIVRLPEGAGTAYLFDEVTEGTELTFRGPQGVFTLPPTLDKDIFLICTGTGIAPFRSMVQYIYQQNIEHKNIYLIFGCRYVKDTLYAEELRTLEQQMPGFRYIATCSRETEDVQVRKGYVHAIYEEIINEHKPDAYFFLCGWKEMIDQAKEKIIQLGYDKKNVHLELYG